ERGAERQRAESVSRFSVGHAARQRHGARIDGHPDRVLDRGGASNDAFHARQAVDAGIAVSNRHGSADAHERRVAVLDEGDLVLKVLLVFVGLLLFFDGVLVFRRSVGLRRLTGLRFRDIQALPVLCPTRLSRRRRRVWDERGRRCALGRPAAGRRRTIGGGERRFQIALAVAILASRYVPAAGHAQQFCILWPPPTTVKAEA